MDLLGSTERDNTRWGAEAERFKRDAEAKRAAGWAGKLGWRSTLRSSTHQRAS
jgi:hypothetical protein